MDATSPGDVAGVGDIRLDLAPPTPITPSNATETATGQHCGGADHRRSWTRPVRAPAKEALINAL
jgi:hypothetical protein